MRTASMLMCRNPKTLFMIEEKLSKQRHVVASLIQARFKGYKQRQVFLGMKAAGVCVLFDGQRTKISPLMTATCSVTLLAKHWRRVLAKRKLERIKKAYVIIAKFVRGFKNRHKPQCAENANVRMCCDGLPQILPLTNVFAG
jgi:myosin-1